MDFKGHPSSIWRQLPKKQNAFLISCFSIIITLVIIYKQLETSTLPKATEAAKVIEIIINTCNWRPEPLQGICDVTKSTIESQVYDNAIDCENACCESNTCISFQFRTKEGCLWGGDTRLGAEKDGVSAWCEPRPPAMWHGQRILKGKDDILIDGACDDRWNPMELGGQCFGLGPKRDTENNTPESCRDACCAQNTNGIAPCSMWQWRIDAGCFYHKSGHGCQEANPLDFEKFIGKRKVVEGRTYTPYAYSHDFADMAIEQ